MEGSAGLVAVREEASVVVGNNGATGDSNGLLPAAAIRLRAE